MWVFYHDVTSAAVTSAPSETGVFIAMGIITAVVIMAPSFFEKRRK